jgi:nucleoside-diphosphate-sugar epimerase
MKILITGGSGFIGSHLSTLLKNQKHQLTIYDLNPPQDSDLNFVSGDILDSKKIIESSNGCDLIIHLAAAVGVTLTDNNPIQTLDFNILGTKNVLEACKINNIPKIIFASSSEIYGEPDSTPIHENDRTTPITTYGLSKLISEEYIKSYSKMYELKYTILRFFNAYGPGQSSNFVIPEFVRLSLNDESIKIHNDGSQIRAFCYISDIVNGISLVLQNGDNEIFNIGNDLEPISIKELGEKIINMTNSTKSSITIPFSESNRNRCEIIRRTPNIDKARKSLEYKPKITLENGLKNIIEDVNTK